MSGDPEQQYFADGIVEETITALSRFRNLFVIARNSSFTYKGRAVDAKQVGRKLGVRYVLEGSVRKAANRVRIAEQLIEAATGTHLWADRFDGTLEDTFDLQDQVTTKVVGAIAPTLEQGRSSGPSASRPAATMLTITSFAAWRASISRPTSRSPRRCGSCPWRLNWIRNSHRLMAWRRTAMIGARPMGG
jgi:TolB-like protein